MEISLGKRIKALRLALKISQGELAQNLKMDRASLSMIENDKRFLKTNELVLLAKSLNISIDVLLDLKSKPEIFLEQIKKPKEKKTQKVKASQKNFQKFKEVLIYILNTVGAKPNVGETTLYKLLCLIDFNYYEKYEEQLIGVTYLKTDQGPTLKEFQLIINELTENKEVEVVKSAYFLHPQKKYLSRRESNLSILNAIEIKHIDEILNKFSDMSPTVFNEYRLEDSPCVVTPNQKVLGKNKRILNHSDIVRAENVTSEKAHLEIGKWLTKFEKLMDLLLKLNYYFKPDVPVLDNNSEDCFFSFCYEKYLEAPYSLHVCNSLMKQGHYLNAMIQLRSLLDYFVSCRYFHKNPHHIIPYRSGKKCPINGKEKWLGTNQIYGFFSENFYDRYYGDMLSRISHGKLGPALYRIDQSNPIEARVILVPEFNLKHSFSIINHLVPLVYGYLSHRLDFFNDRLIELPQELEKESSESIQWLKMQHEKQAERYPESKNWIEGINNVIGISF